MRLSIQMEQEVNNNIKNLFLLLFFTFYSNYKGLSPVQHHNFMKSIEENTEKLDLLERTVIVEQKQKQRLEALALEQQQQIENAKKRQLFEGHATTSTPILDQEDAHRKELVDTMVRECSSSQGPIVKVLTNVNGKLKKKNAIHYISYAKKKYI